MPLPTRSEGRGLRFVLPYTASTRTISLSSSALIFSTASSEMAAPSRVKMRTPLISTLPNAGTR